MSDGGGGEGRGGGAYRRTCRPSQNAKVAFGRGVRARRTRQGPASVPARGPHGATPAAWSNTDAL
eukprot:354421-Chlamydomonas_euryale.AAC.1